MIGRATCAFGLAVVTSACGFLDAGAAPVIVTHRVSSPSGVAASVARADPAFEADVVLTADLVPVVSHSPHIHPEQCRWDGGELPVLVRDVTLAELREVRCDETPIVTLDALLSPLEGSPSTVVYLDVKYDPETTPPAEDFAREVMAAWDARGLPNPLFVESALPEGTRAFAGFENATPVLGWPRFTEEDHTLSVAVANELVTMIGFRHPVADAQDGRARGLGMDFRLADRQMVEAARDEGLVVFLWTVNDRDDLQAYCRWPIDFLMTDFPERAPCR